MQIDTHIIDTTETENNVKNLDLSLIQGRRFKKSCSPVPKKVKFDDTQQIVFSVFVYISSKSCGTEMFRLSLGQTTQKSRDL